jgi:hypothetical protein
MTTTNTHTKTAQRIFEMMTENTGTHFLDSGMSEGRHWQQNRKRTLSDFLARPKANLETTYGLEVSLDLFHFLNDRVTLTPLAEELQEYFEEWISGDDSRSFYDCWNMEEFAHIYGQTERQPDVANSYNWDNHLDQVIQYVTFENAGNHFVILQVHGGADVRGGYTRPQVFEMLGEYAFYDMTDVSIQCTNKECDFTLDIRGMRDVTDADGSLWDGNVYELKACPDCNGQLEALAPEASSSW